MSNLKRKRKKNKKKKIKVLTTSTAVNAELHFQALGSLQLGKALCRAVGAAFGQALVTEHGALAPNLRAEVYPPPAVQRTEIFSRYQRNTEL